MGATPVSSSSTRSTSAPAGDTGPPPWFLSASSSTPSSSASPRPPRPRPTVPSSPRSAPPSDDRHLLVHLPHRLHHPHVRCQGRLRRCRHPDGLLRQRRHLQVRCWLP